MNLQSPNDAVIDSTPDTAISAEDHPASWSDHWQHTLDQVDLAGLAGWDRLVASGWLVLDQALPEVLYQGLCLEAQDTRDYRAAELVTGGRQAAVRSDSTRWIEAHDRTAQSCGVQYLAALDGLGQVLNRSLYTGIRSVEAHFACYQPGQFYAQHRDNPVGSSVRAISTVLYLNGGVHVVWQDAWGGAIRLEDLQGLAHEVLPQANRMVVFVSDLPHEVLPASRVRRSIAGWLRRD